jgi:predicted ABC-type exoprotein transport system permease subunit
VAGFAAILCCFQNNSLLITVVTILFCLLLLLLLLLLLPQLHSGATGRLWPVLLPSCAVSKTIVCSSLW